MKHPSEVMKFDQMTQAYGGPVAFALRRERILDELVQMKRDIDHWNETHPNERPLVFDANLARCMSK